MLLKSSEHIWISNATQYVAVFFFVETHASLRTKRTWCDRHTSMDVFYPTCICDEWSSNFYKTSDIVL